MVNGEVAVLGQKINKNDEVRIDPKTLKKTKEKYYIAFNKPEGVVSHNPQLGEKSTEDYTRKISARLSPLGRLDKASHGLMILSNDGTIVDKVLNPKDEHEKEYLVKVDKRITREFIANMRKGVNIEGYRTKPAEVSKLDPYLCKIVLTEGKKHQIRRMCAALGYQVQDLKRIRIQNIRLGKLKSGAIRRIDGKELLEFFESIKH